MGRRRKLSNPFGQRRDKVYRVVDGDMEGYFAFKGFATPLTSPEEIQILERQEEQATEIIFTVLDRCARKNNFSREDAQKYYYGAVLADGTEIAPQGNLDDDLLPSENARMITLSKDVTPRLKILTVTNLMQNRLLYPLEVLAASDSDLKVRKPWYAIAPGDLFLFDNQKIKVVKILASSEDIVDIEINKLAFKVEPGDVGFLMADDGLGYETGDPDWSLDDTVNNLPTAARASDPPRFVDKLYAAYRADIRGEKLPEDEPQEMSDADFLADGNPSDSTETQSQLIGTRSAGNSSTMDAQTTKRTSGNLIQQV